MLEPRRISCCGEGGRSRLQNVSDGWMKARHVGKIHATSPSNGNGTDCSKQGSRDQGRGRRSFRAGVSFHRQPQMARRSQQQKEHPCLGARQCSGRVVPGESSLGGTPRPCPCKSVRTYTCTFFGVAMVVKADRRCALLTENSWRSNLAATLSGTQRHLIKRSAAATDDESQIVFFLRCVQDPLTW